MGGVRIFWREFRQTFETTGAVLPSSRFLARTITERARAADRPVRLLEAGPGTGPFTDLLVRQLGPGDELTLVELNDRFVDHLRHRLETEPAWRERRSQVHVRHGSVEDLPPEERYHAVVCGLPFNNFDPELVDRLFAKLLGAVAPGGSFSFFEYFAIRTLKAPFVARASRERLAAIARTIEGYCRRCETRDRLVLRNVPPAVVHHLRVSG